MPRSNPAPFVVVGALQKQKNIAGALAFWMANASELLNFIKQDRDLSRITLDAQDILAHLVQMAFKSVAEGGLPYCRFNPLVTSRKSCEHFSRISSCSSWSSR